MKKTIVALILALFVSTAVAQVDDYRPPGGGGSSAAGVTVGMTDIIGTCVFSGQAGVLYKDPSTGKVQCSAGFVFDPTTGIVKAKTFSATDVGASAINFKLPHWVIQDFTTGSIPEFGIYNSGAPGSSVNFFDSAAIDQMRMELGAGNGGTLVLVVNSGGSPGTFATQIPFSTVVQDNAGNGEVLAMDGSFRFFLTSALSSEAWKIEVGTGDLVSVGSGRDVKNSGVLTPGTDATPLTDAAGKVLAARVNSLTESQVTSLVSDLAGKSTAFTDSAGLAALLSDETGSSGGFVRADSPTIITPTVANFANAQHNHSNAAGGGNIPESSVTNLVSDLAAKASSGQDYLTFGGVSFSTLISGASVAGSYKPSVALTLTRISGQIMVQGSCSGGCTTTDHTLRVTDGTTNSDCTNASAVACDAAVGTKFSCTPSNTSRSADQHLVVEALPTSSACTTPPIFAITAEARH